MEIISSEFVEPKFLHHHVHLLSENPRIDQILHSGWVITVKVADQQFKVCLWPHLQDCHPFSPVYFCGDPYWTSFILKSDNGHEIDNTDAVETLKGHQSEYRLVSNLPLHLTVSKLVRMVDEYCTVDALEKVFLTELLQNELDQSKKKTVSEYKRRLKAVDEEVYKYDKKVRLHTLQRVEALFLGLNEMVSFDS